MNPEIESQFKEELIKSHHYMEFLSYLGIDPTDYEDEFDIEMDDYSK